MTSIKNHLQPIQKTQKKLQNPKSSWRLMWPNLNNNAMDNSSYLPCSWLLILWRHDHHGNILERWWLLLHEIFSREWKRRTRFILHIPKWTWNFSSRLDWSWTKRDIKYLDSPKIYKIFTFSNIHDVHSLCLYKL